MKNILFVQLPPPRFDFCESPLNIPLAAAFNISALKSARGQKDNLIKLLDLRILERLKTDVLGDQGVISAICEANPAVLCMTLYVWNVQRGLFIASMVKRILPQAKIVIGGPEVTKDNEWVLRHPAVDAGVFGEGESRIFSVLEVILGNSSCNQIPGTFFKTKNELNFNDLPTYAFDLNSCPYPYINGSLNTELYSTAFVETARGCPFKCRYCFYHKSFKGIRLHSTGRLLELFKHLYSKSSRVSEIYLMDPTFNARPDFRDILSILKELRHEKDIKLHTELRSDLLTDDDTKLFRDAGLRSAEIGLQSSNPVALKLAGRKGNPESVMAGAKKLKDQGIEVTTGIILGLPGDTPEGFTKTLNDLKRSEAYSVIHPFTLSVLPGTEFRTNAKKLGLKYHDRPPYHVYETASFTRSAFQDCLLEFENKFETELDHINPPSLVSDRKSLITEPQTETYISKWIITSEKKISDEIVDLVASKSTDPFTLWFKGTVCDSDKDLAPELLRKFCDFNPYTSLHVILEGRRLPENEIVRRIIDSTAQPSLYLNRYYHPLYDEDEVISPCVWIIIDDPNSDSERERLIQKYETIAKIIWKKTRIDIYDLLSSWTPLFLSPNRKYSSLELKKIFEALSDVHEDSLEEVLFSDVDVQNQWDYEMRKLELQNRFVERILET